MASETVGDTTPTDENRGPLYDPAPVPADLRYPILVTVTRWDTQGKKFLGPKRFVPAAELDDFGSKFFRVQRIAGVTPYVEVGSQILTRDDGVWVVTRCDTLRLAGCHNCYVERANLESYSQPSLE